MSLMSTTTEMTFDIGAHSKASIAYTEPANKEMKHNDDDNATNNNDNDTDDDDALQQRRQEMEQRRQQQRGCKQQAEGKGLDDPEGEQQLKGELQLQQTE